MSECKLTDQTVVLEHISPSDLPLWELSMEVLGAIVVPASSTSQPDFVVTGNITQEQYDVLVERWPSSEVVIPRELARYLPEDLSVEDMLAAAKAAFPF